MRTLAVIPARLGATRLPRKPLRLLAGLPLVVRVWERVTKSALRRASSSRRTATRSRELAESHGAEVVSRRTPSSGTHRVAEVARRPEFADFDVIVNVQGDEPFVSRSAVLGATRMVIERGFPLGTAAVVGRPPRSRDPNVVKVVAADDGRAMYFSRAPIPYLRESDGRGIAAAADLAAHRRLRLYPRSRLMQWTQPAGDVRSSRSSDSSSCDHSPQACQSACR